MTDPTINDLLDGRVRLRVGRSVGRTIYFEIGDEPSKNDMLVGVMDTPELASILVDSYNYCFHAGGWDA